MIRAEVDAVLLYPLPGKPIQNAAGSSPLFFFKCSKFAYGTMQKLGRSVLARFIPLLMAAGSGLYICAFGTLHIAPSLVIVLATYQDPGLPI